MCRGRWTSRRTSIRRRGPGSWAASWRSWLTGRAYLTEHTARLVEGWFRLADLGPTVVKGAHEALGVFVLEGPSSTSRTESTSRLVGRAKELAVLEDALAAATEGRAQVVGVV